VCTAKSKKAVVIGESSLRLPSSAAVNKRAHEKEKTVQNAVAKKSRKDDVAQEGDKTVQHCLIVLSTLSHSFINTVS
jgi:hypothetical protein